MAPSARLRGGCGPSTTDCETLVPLATRLLARPIRPWTEPAGLRLVAKEPIAAFAVEMLLFRLPPKPFLCHIAIVPRAGWLLE